MFQREQEKLEEGVLQREHERRRKECCNEKTRGEGRSVATKKQEAKEGMLQQERERLEGVLQREQDKLEERVLRL